MTLIEIYCTGVVVEALYMLVKRLSWSEKKVAKFREGAEQFEKKGLPFRKLAPFMLVLMALLWPYNWIERLLLKRR